MMCIDVTYELNSDVTEFAELVPMSKIAKVKYAFFNANYSLGLNSPFSSYVFGAIYNSNSCMQVSGVYESMHTWLCPQSCTVLNMH